MEWKNPQSPCKKKFKTQPSAGKLTLTVFWDSQGPVLEHYQERGTTINNARYSEMLTGRLKPAVRRKRRRLLSKSVVLLHDNARPHSAAHSAETQRKLKFEVMAHPPYSPDLGPSDYHVWRTSAILNNLIGLLRSPNSTIMPVDTTIDMECCFICFLYRRLRYIRLRR